LWRWPALPPLLLLLLPLRERTSCTLCTSFIIRRIGAPRGQTLSLYHDPLTAVAATAAETPQAVLPSRQYETVG